MALSFSQPKQDEATLVAIRERESDDQICVNVEKVAALVNFDTQVLGGKSTRNVLVRESKFYCATTVIVGVRKIKDFGSFCLLIGEICLQTTVEDKLL
ncbi:hypothetical protein Tco_0002483 [Tanacetum coccineum]